MERVYLLLRNNQQSGPFTIGELMQQQLRSSDMFWVEGKSTAWTYLSELELIPFGKNSEAEEQRSSFRNEDEIERKAEALRQRTLISPRRTYLPEYTTEIETYPSSYKLPEEEIQFVDHRKERKNKKSAVFGELLLTCLVIGLFMIGIYKGRSFLGVNEKVQNSVATHLDSGDQHTAQKNKPAVQPVVVAIDTNSMHTQDSLLALQKSTQKAPTRKKVIDLSIQSTSLKPINLNQQEKKDDNQTSSASEETAVTKDELSKKELVPSVPEIKTNAEPVKEEKKGFLKGLFKKKKKEDTSIKEEGN